MKALIAMSGGVDSSVAALLMQEHERIGCTMRLFDKEDDDDPKSCCSLKEGRTRRRKRGHNIPRKGRFRPFFIFRHHLIVKNNRHLSQNVL